MKTLGKIVFALPFMVFGINHFMNAGAMGGMVPSFFPAPVFWVYLTGAALILASISMIINRYAKIGAVLLAAMLLIFVLTIHIPGIANAPDQGAMMQSMSQMLKDLAMAGGALVVSSISKN
ncbi:MAG: DoxX family membrane protein [Bacteroidales bacterium]